MEKLFLIEYSNGCFINGLKVDWVKVSPESVSCTLVGDEEHLIEVDKDYQRTFVNNLQAINDNISSVEKSYCNLNN